MSEEKTEYDAERRIEVNGITYVAKKEKKKHACTGCDLFTWERRCWAGEAPMCNGIIWKKVKELDKHTMTFPKVTLKHLAMIMDELQKARQKHPFFASSIRIETGEESWTTGIMRDQLRLEVQNGGASAETILQCEIAEAMEAYVMGDYDHCLQELAQCAAVVFRTMDMVAEKLKKGDNSEPNISSR